MSETRIPPTLTKVAEIAGVSIATVSRVFRERPDVSEDARQRVLEAAKELGYTSGANQKQKSKDTIRYITIVIDYLDNQYVDVIVQGILEQLNAHSFQAVLKLIRPDLKWENNYLEVIRRTGSEGLLIVSSDTRNMDFSSLIEHQLEYVFVGHGLENFQVPCVQATNWKGARDATNHLIELGHRRIGLVAGRANDSVSDAREHGYRSALIDAGIPYEPAIVRAGSYDRISGYEAARQLLSLEERPTAIFACSDGMAMGILEAAWLMGLRVPEDLSLVGFDDLPLASSLHPPLTTVRQPLRQMGSVAAQMLVTLIEGRSLLAPQVELPTQLIIRQSCQPFRQG